MTEILLETQQLCKQFGALKACSNVSIKVKRGELHGLIGPNGAGKTTLIDLISGTIQADSGTILFNGTELTRKPLHVRSKQGLVRSFQVTSVFNSFTVEENLIAAVLSRSGSSFRFFSRAVSDSTLREPAHEVMERIGLKDKRLTPAANLSHGERGQLEMGMALATQPKMLLLDEPMAGLGPGGTVRLTELINTLKESVTILLVEHDMSAVFSLADRITVLVQGEVAATGTPDEIQLNEMVQKAYLGQGVTCLS